jgi:tryptophanyl-tRNA synthetase
MTLSTTELGQSPVITGERPRVLSGMRPTGRLHLGNYMGALYNWVKLQHEYECYFFIADWHALTTDYADPSQLKQNVFDLALDFLAGGLDPDHCTIFVQSHVPQHAELNLLFSMFTPLSLLERVPTYKDQQEQLREKDLATYGFLGYPLLQSADILLYKPAFVPVGQDQESHVELTREVARRFNTLYRRRSSPTNSLLREAVAATRQYPEAQEFAEQFVYVLPEPEVLLTPSPKLPGIDGRKMSKSYGNTILMTDPFSVVMEKTHSMSNGGQRPTQHDPGNPEICPVGDLHRIFSEPLIDDRIRAGCMTATIRCDECKHLLGTAIGSKTHTILNRRMELEENPDRVWQILEEGTERATRRAEETMREIRNVTGLSRDRSGVRVTTPKYGVGSERNVRDLTNMKAWRSLEPSLFLRNIRELWRADIVPTETALKKDAEGIWLTRNNRRVFVVAAIESEASAAWNFSVKPKSYEVIVLLCWGKDFLMHDFVVPQKLYVAQWTSAKKTAGKENIDFSVAYEGDHYFLQLPGSDAIDITATISDYAILGT